MREPKSDPSIKNCTPETATSSVEETEIVTVPETVSPLDGESIVDVGGVRSLKETAPISKLSEVFAEEAESAAFVGV